MTRGFGLDRRLHPRPSSARDGGRIFGGDMDFFSIRNAWRHGLDLFSGHWLEHLVILLVIGIVPIFGLPLLLAPPPSDPGTLRIAQEAAGPMSAEGAVASGLAMVLGLTLQTASYFASWRRGLCPGRTLGGAIGYGLLAGLMIAIVYGLLMAAAVLASGWIGAGGAWLLGILVFLIPLATGFAIVYTLFAAFVAVFLATTLVLAMIFGTLMGDIGFAATLVGGSGMITVVLVVMSAVLLWLAARFSCTTSVMAERRSFNLIAAMRESWRLTLDEQWAIVRYLALIAFALALILVGGTALAGIGVRGFVEGGVLPDQDSLAGALIAMVVSVPLAFLSVLVPAGIYRELEQGAATAEVFA